MADKVQFVVEAVDNASTTLGKIDKQVKKLTDNGKTRFSKFSQTVKDNEGTIMGLGIASGVAFNSIIGGISESVGVFSEFEAKMSGVKAVLTPTTEEFQKLNDKSIELGKSTKFSALEVASSMEMLAKNGLNTTEILNGANEATLNLASSTGAQLTTAADIASSAMLVFGKNTKDLNQVVNSITGTTNLSKFGIEDYGLALAQGGGAAEVAGVSFEDFNASIAGISPLFQSGSDAGTSFKTFLLSLNPSTKGATTAMKDLGLWTEKTGSAFFDNNGKMKSMSEVSGLLQNALKGLSDEQRISSLEAIFGTDALRAASGMAGISATKFNELSKAIEGTSAFDNAKIRADNFKGTLEKFNGSIETLKITIGQTLTPAISQVITIIQPLIDKIQEFSEKNPQLTSSIIIGTTAFIGLSAVLIGIGFLIPPLITGFGLITGAITAIGAPILIIIGIIGALAVAFSTDFMGIKTKTIEIFDFLKVYIVDIWTSISSFLTNLWEEIKNITNNFLMFIKNLWEGTLNFLKKSLEIILIGIGLLFGNFFLLVTGDFKQFGENMTTLWGMLWSGIKNTTNNILLLLGGVIINGYNSINNSLINIFNNMGLFIKNKYNEILESSKNIINAISTLFTSEGREQIYNGFTGMFSGIGEYVQATFDGVLNYIKGVVNNMLSFINSTIALANKVPGISMETIKPLEARATGGPVNSSQSYLVGEKGPEIFTPSNNGFIIPNNKITPNTPNNNNITINISGVNVNNKNDADILANKIIEKITRQLQLSKLNII